MGMAAVVRRTLLSLLQERARAEGVRMRFQHEIHFCGMSSVTGAGSVEAVWQGSPPRRAGR